MTKTESHGARHRRGHRPLLVLAVLPFLAACPPEDQRTGTVNQDEVAQALSPEARAELDLANVAYRAGDARNPLNEPGVNIREGDYETALSHFERVVEMAPDDATGWFGIFMAQNALGNAEAAEEALAEARSRAPGASLIHDTVPPGP